MTLQPLYTAQNCTPAFQLRWSLSLFPKQPLPSPEHWLERLQAATEPDGVRVLECQTRQDSSIQFLISTTPAVPPPQIVKSVKGRLQHTLRPVAACEFRRNFRLTSLGDARLEIVEDYVARQLIRHPLADGASSQSMEQFQMTYPDTDLSQPVNSAHGQYVIALHIVLVHAERWRTCEASFHTVTKDAIHATAAKKGHRISRIAILADHVHLTAGVGYQASPSEVVLAYMNNVAYRHAMLRMWIDSFYVGTIGPYDMAAVRS
jgi:REP element-mobilizing transposase RayT